MIKKKKKIRYEFYNYDSPIGNVTSRTLVLNNPASVKFIGTDAVAGNSLTIINNSYKLQSVIDFVGGTAIYPYELILDNNIDEEDFTIYTIIMKPSSQLKVIAKYYINDL